MDVQAYNKLMPISNEYVRILDVIVVKNPNL